MGHHGAVLTLGTSFHHASPQVFKRISCPGYSKNPRTPIDPIFLVISHGYPMDFLGFLHFFHWRLDRLVDGRDHLPWRPRYRHIRKICSWVRLGVCIYYHLFIIYIYIYISFIYSFNYLLFHLYMYIHLRCPFMPKYMIFTMYGIHQYIKWT